MHKKNAFFNKKRHNIKIYLKRIKIAIPSNKFTTPIDATIISIISEVVNFLSLERELVVEVETAGAEVLLFVEAWLVEFVILLIVFSFSVELETVLLGWRFISTAKEDDTKKQKIKIKNKNIFFMFFIITSY